MQIELLRRKDLQLPKEVRTRQYHQPSQCPKPSPLPHAGRESAVNSLGREALSEVGIPLCIVVSRRQNSPKVEKRTWFIQVFTPDTFYDNRQRFPAHVTSGSRGEKWNRQPRAELNFLEMVF